MQINTSDCTKKNAFKAVSIPLKRIFMSSTESMATPAMPISPVTRSWSESYPAFRCQFRILHTKRSRSSTETHFMLLPSSKDLDSLAEVVGDGEVFHERDATLNCVEYHCLSATKIRDKHGGTIMKLNTFATTVIYTHKCRMRAPLCVARSNATLRPCWPAATALR